MDDTEVPVEGVLRRVAGAQGVPIKLADGETWIIGQAPLVGALSDEIEEATIALAEFSEEYAALADEYKQAQLDYAGEVAALAAWEAKLPADREGARPPEPVPPSEPSRVDHLQRERKMMAHFFEVAFAAMRIHYPRLTRAQASTLITKDTAVQITKAVRGFGPDEEALAGNAPAPPARGA